MAQSLIINGEIYSPPGQWSGVLAAAVSSVGGPGTGTIVGFRCLADGNLEVATSLSGDPGTVWTIPDGYGLCGTLEPLPGQVGGTFGGGTNYGITPTPTPSEPRYTVTGLVHLNGVIAPEHTVVLVAPGNSSVTLTAPTIPGWQFFRWERHVSDFNLSVSFLPSFTIEVAYSDLVFYAYYGAPTPQEQSPLPSNTPTPTPTPTPNATPSPSATPNATPSPSTTAEPTPTPTPSPSADVVILPPDLPPPPPPTPSVPPRIVDIGDALRVTENSVEFVYDKGSHVIPMSHTIQLTNLFSDSTLVVTISSPYVVPNTVSLGPNETKSVVITITSVEYLESLPFGDTLGQIPVIVSRTLIPTPTPPPPPPPVTPTPEIVRGCTDPTAANYNSLAVEDDGSCQYITTGCRDPKAINYDPSADEDTPDTCKYKLAIQMVSGNEQTASTNGMVPNSLSMQVVQIDADSGVTTPVGGIPIAITPNGATATITNLGHPTNMTSAVSDSDGNLEVTWKIDTTSIIAPQVRFSISSSTVPSKYAVVTSAVWFTAARPATLVRGCTDQTATNYNRLATWDDGSCVGGSAIHGCMDPTATNYNPQATIDDRSCVPVSNIPTAPVVVSGGPYPPTPGPGTDAFNQLLARRPLAPVMTMSVGAGPVLTTIYPNTPITMPVPIGATIYLSTYQPASSVWDFSGWVDGHTATNSVGNVVFTRPGTISNAVETSITVPPEGLNLYALYTLPLPQIPAPDPITIDFNVPPTTPPPTPTKIIDMITLGQF